MFFFDLFHPKLRPPGGHREASGAAREAPNAPLRRAQRPPEIPNRTRMLPNTSRAHPRWIPGATGKNVFFRPKIRPPCGVLASAPPRPAGRSSPPRRYRARAKKRNVHISTEYFFLDLAVDENILFLHRESDAAIKNGGHRIASKHLRHVFHGRMDERITMDARNRRGPPIPRKTAVFRVCPGLRQLFDTALHCFAIKTKTTRMLPQFLARTDSQTGCLNRLRAGR